MSEITYDPVKLIKEMTFTEFCKKAPVEIKEMVAADVRKQLVDYLGEEDQRSEPEDTVGERFSLRRWCLQSSLYVIQMIPTLPSSVLPCALRCSRDESRATLGGCTLVRKTQIRTGLREDVTSSLY